MNVWFIANWLCLNHSKPLYEGGYLIEFQDKFVKIHPYNCTKAYVLIPLESSFWGYLPIIEK